MKIVHLSDLHLGKKVNEFSMIEDQEYILSQILNVIDKIKADAVIIAGDVYDKAVPVTEAVRLFDNFLFKLSERALQVFVISGNHDSAERISFGSRLMNRSGIHFSHVFDGQIDKFTLTDAENISVYMLPFIKPQNVRAFFPDEKIESYTDAMRVALSKIPIDKKYFNILVTHQFVTGAIRSESEEISVGGSDNVDVSVFDEFDYVALGHIHGPQRIVRENVRYCGTPLKYSFSEVSHTKSVTVLEVVKDTNDSISTSGTQSCGYKSIISTIPLTPLHDMREIKGTFNELVGQNKHSVSDYLHITLTDEDDVMDAIAKLRVVYPNIMKLDYDNLRTRSQTILETDESILKKSPVSLFEEFFSKQNGQEMSDNQKKYSKELIQKIWERQA